jgi:predicted transcriptional regulator
MSDKAPEQLSSAELLRMTAEVVSAYVRSNPLPRSELTSIIRTVHGSLAALDGGDGSKAEPLRPAVSIRRSVQPDYLVCLDDGKKLKMLKRHLRTTYGLTPEEYRAKWGLPPDYPMVAPNYAKQRSEFAKKIGLGRKPGRRRRK